MTVVIVAGADAPKFSSDLEALIVKCKLTDPMKKWLLDNDCCECLDVALLANEEVELIKNVGDNLPSDNSVAWGLVDKKNIKKLWTFCKQATPQAASGAGVQKHFCQPR